MSEQITAKEGLQILSYAICSMITFYLTIVGIANIVLWTL